MMHASLIAQKEAAEEQPPINVFREKQDFESTSFLSLFRDTGIFILVGNRAENGSGGRNLRLFRCTGRRVVYASEVPCTESVLVQDGVYVLEQKVKTTGRGSRRAINCFLWWGPSSDWSTRQRARAICTRLGKKTSVTVSVVNDGSAQAEKDFLFLLGDESKSFEECRFAASHFTGSDIDHFVWSNQLQEGCPELFKLRMHYSSGGSECRLERVPLLRVVFRGDSGIVQEATAIAAHKLDEKSTYILDVGVQMFVCVGAKVVSADVRVCWSQGSTGRLYSVLFTDCSTVCLSHTSISPSTLSHPSLSNVSYPSPTPFSLSLSCSLSLARSLSLPLSLSLSLALSLALSG
jgi:hypothetical protein